MSKRQIIIVLGFWVIILPFLGFPSSGQKFLSLVTGVIIIILSARIQKKSQVVSSKPSVQTSFVESNPVSSSPINKTS